MEIIMKAENLTKTFADVKAVDHINIEVGRGELFSLLGVNGAGKSTTINMLSTLSEPTDGSAAIAGYQLGKENQAIKKHIGIVYQNNCLDPLLSVKENLITRGALYESDQRILTRNLYHVSEILELNDVIERPFGKLSGGQKRRCEIARALMHSPEILFLDEPTTGLDPATRECVWKSIDELRRNENMTVFLTTHYMEETAKASHIAIMDQGHIIQYGTPFSLKECFAGDKLNLIPKDRQALTMHLEEYQIRYKEREEVVCVSLKRTLDAIGILNKMRDFIEGFEVVQGTMDDVFLNVTGKEITNA